jgi:cell division protein FtsB
MLCLSINYRAFCEMSREVDENQNLSGRIETLKDENLALQEEIHNLKTDSESIRREARRLGIIGGNEQSPVPGIK